jgi:hypothetical protein
MRALKDAFDSKHILNRDRVFARLPLEDQIRTPIR